MQPEATEEDDTYVNYCFVVELSLRVIFLQFLHSKVGSFDNTFAFSFRVFTKNGTRVVVDSASFELIKGSTVDYVQEMIKSSFAVVNNPQSVSSCGCGSSFALKNFAANPAAH